MSESYILFHQSESDADDTFVCNFIKLDKGLDIYDYLTHIYLRYVKTGTNVDYKVLCDRLDEVKNFYMQEMVPESRFPELIGYDQIYQWIKNDCLTDQRAGGYDSDRIKVIRCDFDRVTSSDLTKLKKSNKIK
jgi:hypothetical protein